MSAKRKCMLAVFVALYVAMLLPQAEAGAPLPGAIFTTTVDGTVVNANKYASKCDVYLDGGPGSNAPARAAGLPAGDYFFQVTDPSGHTLLSTDPVSNRRFQVSSSGVITAYTGVGGPVHAIGTDLVHPETHAITVSLANATCPADYLDSPNTGGVYKVWVTPVNSFVGDPNLVDNSCGNGCFHGFSASASKTDNFKVQPATPTFCLTVEKQLVDFGGNITPGAGWQMTLTDPNGASNNANTDDTGVTSFCGLVAGNYTVTEPTSDAWKVLCLIVSGAALPPQATYSFSWAAGQPAPVVIFQNQSLLQ